MTRQIEDIEVWSLNSPSDGTDSLFSSVKENLTDNWGRFEIEVSSSGLSSFTPSDWREFQDFLEAMSVESSSGYYDTAEKLATVLRETISLVENSTKSIPQLLACIGTLAKLNYSQPYSGETYGAFSEEKCQDLQLEQDVLKALAPRLTKLPVEDIYGDVFEGLELLSDMGRFTFLMFYLYHDDGEIPQLFFDKWGASDSHISSDLSSVLLAAGKFQILETDQDAYELYKDNLENAKINPRFLHFFVDDSRVSLLWWMELSTWHEFHHLVEGFDKLMGYWGEFVDPKILLTLFESALTSEKFADEGSEDILYFEKAIDFLRELVESGDY
jgi:hypothetical protein